MWCENNTEDAEHAGEEFNGRLLNTVHCYSRVRRRAGSNKGWLKEDLFQRRKSLNKEGARIRAVSE